MHDTDRTLAELAGLDGEVGEADFELEDEDFENEGDFEFEPESGAEMFGEAEFEDESDFEDEGDFEAEAYAGQADFEDEGDFEGDFEADEAEETELAAELLGVQSEEELENFIGDALKRAVGKIGQALKTPTGQQLVGLLKQAAKKILPGAGAAIGTALGGPAGGALGGDIAANAAKLFGLELEGLTAEDQELEAARGFMRFVNDAGQQVLLLPARMNPRQAARMAYRNAARRYAPGLLATTLPAPNVDFVQRQGRGVSGRWTRVAGNQIVLYGL